MLTAKALVPGDGIVVITFYAGQAQCIRRALASRVQKESDRHKQTHKRSHQHQPQPQRQHQHQQHHHNHHHHQQQREQQVEILERMMDYSLGFSGGVFGYVVGRRSLF